MENNSDHLVTLLTASLIHEVHIAKTLLANYDIETYVVDENIATSIGTAFVEGYKLMVSSNDYEKAKNILNEIQEKEN
ncbi:MAG: DUF2007 domain-containing protein [Lutibacter sp.]|nr:DUF2007 domain-containing protein [Lutibacter sp.]MBP9600436.1 DUF2007 domain-containing protein [Lutibacter sp.]